MQRHAAIGHADGLDVTALLCREVSLGLLHEIGGKGLPGIPITSASTDAEGAVLVWHRCQDLDGCQWQVLHESSHVLIN